MDNSQRHDAVRQVAAEDPVTVTVQGQCMTPLIESEARVHVTPAGFYWPGDVVVVLSGNGHYLVHRVLGVYRRSGTVKMLTQADSALRPDPAVSMKAILGRVSGGDCHPHIVFVPFSHRLKALLGFIRFSTNIFLKRIF